MLPGSETSVRGLLEKDLAAIHELSLVELSVRRTIDETRSCIFGQNQVVRVLVDHGAHCIGYALGWQVRDIAELTEIAIAAPSKGRGFGRLLCTNFLSQVKQAGAKSIDLEVKDNNRIAIGLYESMGFLKVGVRAKYYRDGCDAWLYSLEVS